MNGLMMGPLPAKKKREVTSAGTPVLALRCGVRDCPEILGLISGIEDGLIPSLNLTRGYFFSLGEKVWIKSRRPGNRMKHHRQAVEDLVTPESEELLLELEKDKDSLAEAFFDSLPQNAFSEPLGSKTFELEFSELAQKQARIQARQTNAKRSKTDIFGAYIDDFPATVKCARCGRLSKIEGAR